MHVHVRRELLVAIVLLSCFAGLFSTSIDIAHATTPRTLFQNQTIYLKSTSSDLQGYRTVSVVAPTSPTNKTIRVSASSVGSYTVGAWISSATLLFQNPITVDLNYNFQFLIYGNSTRTANASFYCSLGVYRNGVESTIFNASTSDKLTENVTGYGWQYALKSSFTFLSGDRLFFRLYLYVSKTGVFDFYYDSASCRSSIVDPPVTRYFRGTSQIQANNFYATSYTVNVGTYKSGTVGSLYTQDTTNTLNVSSAIVGINNVTSIILIGNFSDASATYSNNLPFISVEYAHFYNGSGGSTKLQFWNYTSGAYQTSGEMYDFLSTPTTSTLKYVYSSVGLTQFRGGSSPTYEWKCNITTYSSIKTFHTAIDYLKVIPRWFNLSTQYTTSDTMGDWNANVPNWIFSIRVWKVNSDRTETEITSGLIANVTASTGYKNNTWTPTKTSGITALCIRIYALSALDFTADPSSDGGTALVFYTEDLGSSNVLEVNQWNVFYHFTYYGAPFRILVFDWGDTSHNGRIENVLIDAGAEWKLISTWTMNLQTRQWNLVSTWREDLSARKWNLIATWTENLVARSWNLISTWTTNLITRQWTSISTWSFDLKGKGWSLISTWTFGLNTGATDEENFMTWLYFLSVLILALFIIFYTALKK